MYVDVSRAYFYAKSVRPTYIKLPAEDPRAHKDGVVGKLMMSMYGTRDAAQNWSEEYSATLKAAGYIRGIANPCLFNSPSEKCGVMVHGDDFVAVGDQKATQRLKGILEKAYKIKCEILGDGQEELDEIRVLNRVIRRDDHGYTLEADPRHAEIVIRDLGLEGVKISKLPGSQEEHKRAGGGPAGAGTYPMLELGADPDILDVNELDVPHVPGGMGKGRGDSGSAASHDICAVDAAPQRGWMPGGVLGDRAGRANAPPQRGTKPGGVVGGSGTRSAKIMSMRRRAEEDPIDESPLEKADAKLFRGVAARLNYLGPDRPDMQYAIKEAARCMASPRQCDWPLLKKIGRYLLYRPRLILRYKWQKRPGCIDGYTDSDWAGCT